MPPRTRGAPVEVTLSVSAGVTRLARSIVVMQASREVGRAGRRRMSTVGCEPSAEGAAEIEGEGAVRRTELVRVNVRAVAEPAAHVDAHQQDRARCGDGIGHAQAALPGAGEERAGNEVAYLEPLLVDRGAKVLGEVAVFVVGDAAGGIVDRERRRQGGDDRPEPLRGRRVRVV